MKQILVVDDDRDLANLLAFSLRLQGYAVQVAANGREALTILEERSFDAILLDWNMPVMDGERFLEQHQLRTASASVTPIVVITARPDAEEKARQLGAVAVVAKPFNFNELLRVLVPLLGDPQ
jgi:DNA-binding response OmpR family regulator